MKRILLTGATGFVGRQVLKRLSSITEVELSVIVRPFKAHQIKDIAVIKKVILTDDLFKESQAWWESVCHDIDLVIHCAWYAEPGKYLNSSKNMDCLIGSLMLVQGAARAGVKKILGLGSCLEYNLDKEVLDVGTELKPNTLYAATKVSLYEAWKLYLKQEKIDFIWCRLFYLYGEGEDARRLVAYIRKQIKQDKDVLLTEGNQVRDYLDVSVAGEKIASLALGKERGLYNICSGQGVTIKSLAIKIAKEEGKVGLLKFGAVDRKDGDPLVVVGVPNC